MLLSYPELPLAALRGEALDRKRLCRTFSDCTTGPRNGMISGCYPLDPYYKDWDVRVMNPDPARLRYQDGSVSSVEEEEEGEQEEIETVTDNLEVGGGEAKHNQE